jgi:hypothetical protein
VNNHARVLDLLTRFETAKPRESKNKSPAVRTFSHPDFNCRLWNLTSIHRYGIYLHRAGSGLGD